MLTTDEISGIYERHVATVYRLCYSYMRGKTDAEDMTQETFLRLMCADKKFENAEHEKAWLIVTAGNVCKNALRRRSRRDLPLNEEALSRDYADKTDETLDTVLKLPEKYKAVIYLFYYEDMKTEDIARTLGKKSATVRSLLNRGRSLLRDRLGDDFDE